MKQRFLVLLTLVAMLVMGLCSVAMAADDPLSLKMELSANRFASPAEVMVTIRVTNTSDADMPGPMALYYPDGSWIEEFGQPVLAAGQSKSWTGPWMVTDQQIADGRIIFGMKSTVMGENGKLSVKESHYYAPIEDADAVAQVEITRRIIPTMAGKGQKVSVIYEVANVGTVDVTDVVIRESSTISKTNGKIASVKAGEKASYTFTVTMNKKDLTSNANITYSAGGKSYTYTVENAIIEYGVVNLSASLKADKKGGNPGDTVKLTLTLKNTGKSAYENVTVTDPSLGTVFSGLVVEAGKTVTQEKEITISKSTTYQFTVTGADASGKTHTAATDTVTVTAVDPASAPNLYVYATADQTALYILPDVVTFTVSVTNNGQAEAKDVGVYASGVRLYTFESILPGQTKSFVRDVQIQMTGNFRFDAQMADQLGATVTFPSDLIRIYQTAPTATPSQVPIATPIKPDKEELPTHDGLPPYVDALESALDASKVVFGGVGAVCVLLIAVGALSRLAQKAKSNRAPDHLERDGYRSYIEAVPAKKRHVMPDQEEPAAPAPVEEETEAEAPAPAEEPAPEADPAVVDEAMAELYPNAEQPDAATYQRRRRHAEDEQE